MCHEDHLYEHRASVVQPVWGGGDDLTEESNKLYSHGNLTVRRDITVGFKPLTPIFNVREDRASCKRCPRSGSPPPLVHSIIALKLL